MVNMEGKRGEYAGDCVQLLTMPLVAYQKKKKPPEDRLTIKSTNNSMYKLLQKHQSSFYPPWLGSKQKPPPKKRLTVQNTTREQEGKPRDSYWVPEKLSRKMCKFCKY